MKLNMMMLRPGLHLGHGKAMEMSLWTAQLLLAVVFGMAGAMKLGMSMQNLGMAMPWTEDVGAMLVHFIGACELAGAAGIVLPSLTRIRPMLTVAAAVALVALMFLATAFHLSRGEYVTMPLPVGLGALAAFVAWGRGVHSPIAAKS